MLMVKMEYSKELGSMVIEMIVKNTSPDTKVFGVFICVAGVGNTQLRHPTGKVPGEGNLIPSD